MKVYILVTLNPSEILGDSVCILGIYSTEEKAKEAWEEIKKYPELFHEHEINDYLIDAFELDETQPLDISIDEI